MIISDTQVDYMSLKKFFGWAKTRPFDHILIVTYGRSGSTLLMGLLNSDADCVIRGENNNYIYYLFQAWRQMEKAKSCHSNATKNSLTSPWWGVDDMDPEAFRESLGPLVRNSLMAGLKESPAVLGFKEIRYLQALREGVLEEYLAFLARLLPNTALVFNYRKVSEVIASKWWAQQSDSGQAESMLLMKEFERIGNAYCVDHPQSAFQIHYEAVCRNDEELCALFNFLGLNYNSDAIIKLLNLKHSY